MFAGARNVEKVEVGKGKVTWVLGWKQVDNSCEQIIEIGNTNIHNYFKLSTQCNTYGST